MRQSKEYGDVRQEGSPSPPGCTVLLSTTAQFPQSPIIDTMNPPFQWKMLQVEMKCHIGSPWQRESLVLSFTSQCLLVSTYITAMAWTCHVSGYFCIVAIHQHPSVPVILLRPFYSRETGQGLLSQVTPWLLLGSWLKLTSSKSSDPWHLLDTMHWSFPGLHLHCRHTLLLQPWCPWSQIPPWASHPSAIALFFLFVELLWRTDYQVPSLLESTSLSQMILLFEDVWWRLIYLLFSAWMNTQELPERKDKAVRHMWNAIFVWWMKVMDFHLLFYIFSSCIGTSGHPPPSSMLLSDLFFYDLLFFCFLFTLSGFSSFGV